MSLFQQPARGSSPLTELKQPIKVLFVPQWYPPREGHNDSEGTFCREHVYATSLYDDVAVLVYSASRSNAWPTLTWERVEDQGVPTFYATYGRSPIPKTTLPFFRLHLRRAILRVIRKWGMPDVIHTQDYYAYYVIQAAKTLGVPFVISQHWTAFIRRTLDANAVRRFRWSFSQAALVFPVNQFATIDYEHYGIQARTTWLPNALDTNVFHSASQTEREPWILHVSGFADQKRFPDVVKAFSRARAARKEAMLHVVGDGGRRQEMQALALRELPANSFYFHGFIPKPQLADLMRRACGLVFPSDAETFGCVLMEAMACGCPVLTTRVGGIPAVVREGEGLFVNVGDIEQIAAGMIQFIDGKYGLDLARISHDVRERFCHKTVGRVLHEGHLRAIAHRKRNEAPTCLGDANF